ncbi:hypothetical protein ACFE04_013470 [Oxalis oulophora]
MVHEFGIPIVSQEQWCPRDKIKIHVFGIPIVSWEQWCLMNEIEDKYENELNVALEKGEPDVVMSEYGFKNVLLLMNMLPTLKLLINWHPIKNVTKRTSEMSLKIDVHSQRVEACWFRVNQLTAQRHSGVTLSSDLYLCLLKDLTAQDRQKHGFRFVSVLFLTRSTRKSIFFFEPKLPALASDNNNNNNNNNNSISNKVVCQRLQYDMMGTTHRSGVLKKTSGSGKIIVSTILGIAFGFFVGLSFPSVSLQNIRLPSNLVSPLDVTITNENRLSKTSSAEIVGAGNTPRIYVPTNPRGAELLPPGIVEAESDFFLRRLWGEPSEDLKKKPKYLVTFTVGLDQKNNIDAAVKKFSDDFTILLFHYDGRTTEWDQFEWSKKAIHVSVKKQTKWWYAKRFLHPDIVAAYEYIFIWDEDLGVQHFDGKKYIEMVKKHGLEISQPGLEPNEGLTWQMTKRRGDREVHKVTEEKPGWCTDPHLPPCAGFVEIMAPVFSREAWRCVWYMIQNDLVHGWGLDFALRRCVEPAHEKIGVVDSQWIVHQVIPSLGSQGQAENGKAPWEGVRDRCKSEWEMFKNRLAEADRAYVSHHQGKG